MGLSWVGDGYSRRGSYRVWALAPVAWIWFRLARYEMSYASAVSVSQSFYDFMMMIFTLLFFFSLARYVAGVGEKFPRMLTVYAFCTGLFGISAPLTRFAMYMMGETAAYNASQLATALDLVIGIFAFAVGVGLVFAKQLPAPETTEEQPEMDTADVPEETEQP